MMGSELMAAFLRIAIDDSNLDNGMNRVRTRIMRTIEGIADRAQSVLSFAFSPTGLLTGFGIGAAVKIAAEFEQSMVNVRAKLSLFGEQGEETFRKLTMRAREMGAATKYTASEVAAGMEELAGKGMDAKQVFDSIPATLELAAASGMSIAAAADIAVANLNVFKLKATELTRVNDALASVDARTATTMAELGQALKDSGNIASLLDIQIEELASSIGAMSSSSVTGSIAGNALAIAMSRLSAPTSDVSSALDDLKIDLADFTTDGKIRFLDLMEAIENSGAGVAEMMAIFGARGKHMLSIFNFEKDGKKGIAAVRELAKAVRGDVGYAAIVAAEKMNTFLGKVKEFTSAIEELVISTITPMFDSMLMVIRPLTAIVRYLAQLNEATGGALSTILMLAGAFGALAIVVPLVASGIATLVTWITAGWTAISGLMAFFSAASWPVVAAIAAVVAVLTAVAGAAMAFYQTIKEAFDTPGGKQLLAQLAEIRGMFADVLEPLTGFGSSIFDLLYTPIKMVGGAIGSVMGSVATFLEENEVMFQAWADLIFNIVGNIRRGFEWVFGIIKSIITTTMQTAFSIIDSVFGSSFSDLFGNAATTVMAAITKILDAISLLTTSIPLTMQFLEQSAAYVALVMASSFTKAVNEIKATFAGLFAAVTAGAMQMATNVLNSMQRSIAEMRVMAMAIADFYTQKKLGGTETYDQVLDRIIKEQGLGPKNESRDAGAAAAKAYFDAYTENMGNDPYAKMADEKLSDAAKTFKQMNKLRDEQMREDIRKRLEAENPEAAKKEAEKKKADKEAEKESEVSLKFVGIPELGRQIQESLTGKDAEKEKREKDDLKLQEKQEEHLQEIAKNTKKIEEISTGLE